MLREQGLIAGNYALFFVFIALMTSLQCSLWLQLFGSFPAPHMWLPPLIYWFLYRRPQESLIMTYLATALVAPLTATPFGLFLAINMVLFGAVFFLKQRLYWAGPTFFMLVSGFCTVFFPVVHFILSWTFDKNPITSPEIFAWIISALLTMLISIPAHGLFSYFDNLTEKEQPTEAGSYVG